MDAECVVHFKPRKPRRPSERDTTAAPVGVTVAVHCSTLDRGQPSVHTNVPKEAVRWTQTCSESSHPRTDVTACAHGCLKPDYSLDKPRTDLPMPRSAGVMFADLQSEDSVGAADVQWHRSKVSWQPL
ncbi:hypothetical protein M8818_007809 [Zalaria obscura]|uniref:Uncharacterized protein n=1 Tax=Zalaria obscura TaxID=2024903 RepID=A0ACC3S480_9PEZI